MYRIDICDFSGADLRQAIFVKSKWQSSRFDGANLYQTIWTEATLVECSLRNSDLTYADFSHGNLERSDFEGAKMFRTKLHKSRDAGARFSDRGNALETDPVLAKAEEWPAAGTG